MPLCGGWVVCWRLDAAGQFLSSVRRTKGFGVTSNGFGEVLKAGTTKWIATALATMLGVVLLGLLWRSGDSNPPPVTAAQKAAAPSEPAPPVEPPPPTAVEVKLNTSIDLLTKIDIQNDVKLGKASLHDGALATSAEHVRSLVSIPVDLPSQYELEMLVTRVAGRDGFILGLNLNSQPCMLTIDGWPTVGGPWATLQQLDGKGPLDADFPGVRYAGSLLKEGQQSRVLLKVDGLKYDLRVDDLPVFYGDATGHTLSRPRFYNNRDYERYPFVASYETHFVIQSMTLRVP